MPQNMRVAEVYTEFVSTGVSTIRGRATAVPCFAGKAPRGSNPQEKAWEVYGWDEYVRLYGGYDADHYMGYAVSNFFLMAGSEAVKAIIKRMLPTTCTQASLDMYGSSSAVHSSSDAAFTIYARSKGTYFEQTDNNFLFSIGTPGRQQAGEFKLTIEKYDGTNTVYVNSYDNLSLTASSKNFIKKVVGEYDLYIDDDIYIGGTIGDGVFYATRSAFSTAGTENQTWGNLSATNTNSLAAFDLFEDATLLLAPDFPGSTDCNTMVTFTETLEFPMFVIGDFDESTTVAAAKAAVNGGTFAASNYLGLFYPWVYINNPIDSSVIKVPPSAHVAGAFARTDYSRGIWKAAAGETDGRLPNVLGLEYAAGMSEMGDLYDANINPIRKVPGIGACIWGSRVHYVSQEWEQIPIRRLFTSMANDVDRQTRWAVFEPITANLFTQLRMSVWGYLKQLHDAGAFYDGGTGDWSKAFFVTCDTTNNTAITQRAKQVVCDWGAAPTYPAEFVVHRITQWDGGRSVQQLTGNTVGA